MEYRKCGNEKLRLDFACCFKLLGEHRGVLRKDAEGVVYERAKGLVIIIQ